MLDNRNVVEGSSLKSGLLGLEKVGDEVRLVLLSGHGLVLGQDLGSKRKLRGLEQSVNTVVRLPLVESAKGSLGNVVLLLNQVIKPRIKKKRTELVMTSKQ